MDTTTWKSITPLGQKRWDQVSEEDKERILSVRNEPGTSAPPLQSQSIPNTVGPPRSNQSRTKLQPFATYFHDDDDDNPDTATSSQSSENIEQMTSEQFLSTQQKYERRRQILANKSMLPIVMLTAPHISLQHRHPSLITIVRHILPGEDCPHHRSDA